MIGFIGAGNMATAIIKGMVDKGIQSDTIYVFDHNEIKMKNLMALGTRTCSQIGEIVGNCKYIFLAVKPNAYDSLLKSISKDLSEDKILITMAAGYEISRVKSIVGEKKVVRTMPNTPSLVGKGFTAVTFDEMINQDEMQRVLEILGSVGHVQLMKEYMMDAYSAVSGSGPAFIFMIMEAMADAAVLLGIPRADAYKVVEATVMGSACLALETTKHPGELKDMVCSPGGTTIEGVRTLEEKGLRSAIIEALINTYKKNIDITKIR